MWYIQYNGCYSAIKNFKKSYQARKRSRKILSAHCQVRETNLKGYPLGRSHRTTFWERQSSRRWKEQRDTAEQQQGWTADTCSPSDEPQRNCGEWEKSVSKHRQDGITVLKDDVQENAWSVYIMTVAPLGWGGKVNEKGLLKGWRYSLRRTIRLGSIFVFCAIYYVQYFTLKKVSKKKIM